jgi:hypothetical protein
VAILGLLLRINDENHVTDQARITYVSDPRTELCISQIYRRCIAEWTGSFCFPHPSKLSPMWGKRKEKDALSLCDNIAYVVNE